MSVFPPVFLTKLPVSYILPVEKFPSKKIPCGASRKQYKQSVVVPVPIFPQRVLSQGEFMEFIIISYEIFSESGRFAVIQELPSKYVPLEINAPVFHKLNAPTASFPFPLKSLNLSSVQHIPPVPVQVSISQYPTKELSISLRFIFFFARQPEAVEPNVFVETLLMTKQVSGEKSPPV